jgi:hypothetical protein
LEIGDLKLETSWVQRGEGIGLLSFVFAWKFDGGDVYWLQDEESDQTGTVCALSDIVLSADGVGGEGLSHGARANDAPHAAKIVIYAIA